MKTNWMTTVKKQLTLQGLRINPVDFATYIEPWAPQVSREILSAILDFFRPLALGLGLRITKLKDTQLEMILPARKKNRNENEQIDEAALLAAALRGAKILWLRNAPLGQFKQTVKNLHLRSIDNPEEGMSLNAKYFLRLELKEAQRELVLSQVRIQGVAPSEILVQVYNENEQLKYEIQITLELASTPQLSERAT